MMPPQRMGDHPVVDAFAKYGREENYSEMDPSAAYVYAKNGPPQRMISESTRSSRRKSRNWLAVTLAEPGESGPIALSHVHIS